MNGESPIDFAMPLAGLDICWSDPPMEVEWRLHGPRIEAVRADAIDKIIVEPCYARFGIITTGNAYLDVC